MQIDYNRISKTYDNYRSYRYSDIMQMISFGKIQTGMKVLDLGCGTGNLSTQLSECVSIQAIGIDQSFEMLKKATAKALRVLCADADESPLPFKNNSFDIVIGAYVIHHIQNRMALIKDCFRILRDDGALILLTSSHDHIERLHPVIREFFPNLIELDKKRFPDTAQLDHMFQTAGFNGIRHEELILSEIPIDMEYLDKVKNKFVSTFYLLSDDEFQAGVEKLEKFITNSKVPVSREWRGLMIYGKKSC